MNEISTEKVDEHISIGWKRFFDGDFDGAIRSSNQAIHIHQGCVDAYWLRGSAFFNKDSLGKEGRVA